MTNCPVFSAEGTATVADALKSVDCQSEQAVEIAFNRLFGESGALGQALTLFLTLYVALFALSLLTGRSGLRLNILTPKMLQLGLVLTFATSWVAYQNVGWTLLAQAPDQIASILLGTKGSATQLFAARLDALFDVIANTAHLAQGANATTTTTPIPQIANSSPKPADLLWAASLLLLLGTVGVLIVARIALAAVMALGPLFIMLALFRGTRGLFEGWLKAAVMLAITPLFAVLLGGGTLVMIAPMIAALSRAGGKVSLELATSIFLAAFVYAALMVLALRAAAMITNGWRLGGWNDNAPNADPAHMRSAIESAAPHSLTTETSSLTSPTDRVRGLITSLNGATHDEGRDVLTQEGVAAALNERRSQLLSDSPPTLDALTTLDRDPRIRPLGQGFRAPTRMML